MEDCQLQQQCPGSSYFMDEGGEELFEIQQEVSDNSSEMESDQWSSYSEGISYEETGDDGYTCRQCCTVGHDELVIPRSHHIPLLADHHNTVHTCCKEMVKNCHHQDYTVQCSKYSKDCRFSCERERYVFPHKKAQQSCQECQAETEHHSEQLLQYYCHSFAVNCTPVQASD